MTTGNDLTQNPLLPGGYVNEVYQSVGAFGLSNADNTSRVPPPPVPDTDQSQERGRVVGCSLVAEAAFGKSVRQLSEEVAFERVMQIMPRISLLLANASKRAIFDWMSSNRVVFSVE